MIVIKDPKTFCFNFDFPKDVDQNLKREIEFIIKSNECLAGNKIKKEIQKNSKTSQPPKSVLNFSERLDLRSSDKHVALQNLSVYSHEKI